MSYQYIENLKGKKWRVIQKYYASGLTLQHEGQYLLAISNYVHTTNLFVKAIFIECRIAIKEILRTTQTLPKKVLIDLKIISPSDWDNPQLSWEVLPEKCFLVNHQYRLIYCPINKVASTALIQQLILSNNPDVTFDANKARPHLEAEYFCSLRTYSFDEAQKILEDSRYLKVVFVRNPWDRLISAYLNKIITRRLVISIVLTASQDKKLPTDYQKTMTFRQFVNYVMVTEDKDLDIHWQPQYLYLGKYHFDFIGKYENLAADFDRLKKIVQIPSVLVKENATSYSSQTIKSDKHFCDYSPTELKQLISGLPRYESFYTPELIECVRQRYQKDIEIFNYSFHN